MLFTMDGKRITEIPRSRMEYFQAVKNILGNTRTQEVQVEFNRLIDDLTADADSGARTFNSSYLGSSLSPWKYPLAHLSDAAAEMAGQNTPEDEVREKSGFSFGLFVWECIMGRDEDWAFYEPNLPGDSNREITGKVYFERP